MGPLTVQPEIKPDNKPESKLEIKPPGIVEEKKETPTTKAEEATMKREFEQIMFEMKKLSRNDSKFSQDH